MLNTIYHSPADKADHMVAIADTLTDYLNLQLPGPPGPQVLIDTEPRVRIGWTMWEEAGANYYIGIRLVIDGVTVITGLWSNSPLIHHLVEIMDGYRENRAWTGLPPLDPSVGTATDIQASLRVLRKTPSKV